ncbi:MAG: MjaI family restriction endonuclease [candidate division Zixibacteria bacterium]|nr:MjaI family restriction endonuclease [candidate division Zixibacteria bacterium]
MKIKIKDEEIRKHLNIETPDFPKYTSQIINLANQNAQGTRPKVVGQMSELIQQFKGRKLSEWEAWYIKRNPDAIKKATQKIIEMVENLKKAMIEIDEPLIEHWVKDLVIVKTFLGLRFQEVILKKGAEIKNLTYRLSSIEEEARGVDGFIGDLPISIKPSTYKVKASLRENIQAKIIYYEKKKDGIEVDYGEVLD